MNLLKSLLFAAALAACVPSWAAEGASGTQEQARADLTVAALKLQVAAERRADTIAAQAGSTSLNLYLGQDASAGSRIERLTLRLDEAAPLEVSFDETTAAALASSAGLAELEKLSVPAGPHVLHASLALRAVTGKPEAPGLELDYAFDSTAGSQPLELHLVAGSLLKPLTLEARPWKLSDRPASWLLQAAKTVAPRSSDGKRIHDRGDNDDPLVRAARLHTATGRHDDALLRLLAVPADANKTDSLPPGYWLQMAAAYRMLGALDQARAICDQLDKLPADKALLSAERLAVAQALRARGELEAAEMQLLKARKNLSAYLLPDWRFSYAQILLTRDRSAEAASLLGEQNPDDVDAYRYLNASAEALRAAQYQRYNLAAALVRTGQEQKGLSWLDLVGRLDSKDPEMLALRDQANLALGWYFLDLKQGKTAIGILGRVGSEGAFSSAALLGMGWSQLAPAGDKYLPRVKLVDTSVIAPESDSTLTAPVRNSLNRLRVIEPELHGAIGPRSFAHEDPPKDRREGLRRALRLWSLLAERDIHDPAIQEGALAIAYALDQLHDSARARAAYDSAIERLVGLRQELAAGQTFVQQGQLITAIDQAPDLRAAMVVLDELRLQPGQAADALHERMRAYRNLAEMLARVDRITTLTGAADVPADAPESSEVPDELRQQATELRNNLLAMRSAEAGLLEQQVLALAQAQDRKLDQYLTAARFSAARIQDRVPDEGPSSNAPPDVTQRPR